MKLIKIFKLRLFIFMITLSMSNFIHAQTMDLVCNGEISVRSPDGKNIILKNETQTYSFKNGKLGGFVSASWSDNSIFVKGPSEKEDPGCFIFCNRSITINRLTGEVNDIYFSKIDNIRHNFWYKGSCSSAKKKF